MRRCLDNDLLCPAVERNLVSIHEEQAELTEREAALVDMYLDPNTPISREVYVLKRDEIEKRNEALEERLARAEAQLAEQAETRVGPRPGPRWLRRRPARRPGRPQGSGDRLSRWPCRHRRLAN